jgi:hypothetical protein
MPLDAVHGRPRPAIAPSVRVLVTVRNAQLGFIDEELADTRSLMKQGLARKPRVLELERMRANPRTTPAPSHRSLHRCRFQIPPRG